VQRSLPCVNNAELGSYAPEPMAMGEGDIPMKGYLQKRIGIGGSRRGNHLGCRKWAGGGLQYGLSGNRVPMLATYRCKDEKETAFPATEGSLQGKPTRPKP